MIEKNIVRKNSDKYLLWPVEEIKVHGHPS
jgi:hypothetical protein